MIRTWPRAALAVAAATPVRASTSAAAWHTAQEVPGTAALHQGGPIGVTSLSCPSAGNCSAGGTREDGSAHFQAFVAAESVAADPTGR